MDIVAQFGSSSPNTDHAITALRWHPDSQQLVVNASPAAVSIYRVTNAGIPPVLTFVLNLGDGSVRQRHWQTNAQTLTANAPTEIR